MRFIKQAQSLGLTLDDVQQLLSGRQRRPQVASCRRVRDLLTQRLQDIDARIKELRAFRRTLHAYFVACEQALAAVGDPTCPTIEALDGTRSRVIYQIAVKPGGRLPGWLVRRGALSEVADVITQVRRCLERTAAGTPAGSDPCRA